MAKKDPWGPGSRQISQLMRKDLVEILISEPTQDDVGEIVDMTVSLGQYKANVTTPPEYIEEETQGTARTHYYEITLDVDVPLPLDKKIFVKLISVRQGTQGAVVEVSQVEGGLLGQTLQAADEKN